MMIDDNSIVCNKYDMIMMMVTDRRIIIHYCNNMWILNKYKGFFKKHCCVCSLLTLYLYRSEPFEFEHNGYQYYVLPSIIKNNTHSTVYKYYSVIIIISKNHHIPIHECFLVSSFTLW